MVARRTTSGSKARTGVVAARERRHRQIVLAEDVEEIPPVRVETVEVSPDDPWLQDAVMLLVALGKRVAASRNSVVEWPGAGRPAEPQAPGGHHLTSPPLSLPCPKGPPWPPPS